MKVLHLYAGNLYGGIERVLVNLTRHASFCPEMEHHFGLCFEGRLASELRELGAPVEIFGAVRMKHPWSVVAGRRKLRSLLLRGDFDVVICHACWPYALFASVVEAHGLPLVLWAHDIPGGAPLVERWARQTSPDLIIANSHHTESKMVPMFPGVTCEVQYPLVPPVKILQRERVRREIRSSLGAGADDVVIVLAARLERGKGHTLLLRALSNMRGVPGWKCWIAGSPQREQEHAYLEELKTLAAREGVADRLAFVAEQFDFRDLMSSGDIHCQPNTMPEAFGITFIEALYLELPIVTVAMGGPLEIVDATCGIFVPPNDAKALTEALSTLVRDPVRRRQLGDGGPQRAAGMCDPKLGLHKLHDSLQMLVKDAAVVA